MSVGSLLNRIRRPLAGATLATALVVGSLVAATPAQASPTGSGQVTGTWQAAKTAPAPHGGMGVQALCFPPTRYINAAVWDCEVFSGQFLQFWIVCSGVQYWSPVIGEGSWRVVGICPAGTIRDDEGFVEF